MNLRILLRWLCLVSVMGAHAPEEKDPELDRLNRTLDAARSQSDMNVASRDIARYWDKKLAAIERQIDAKLDAGNRKRFAESKARWHKYREQEVEFHAAFFDGGSMQPLIANSHYALLTEHRVQELEALYVDALESAASADGPSRFEFLGVVPGSTPKCLLTFRVQQTWGAQEDLHTVYYVRAVVVSSSLDELKKDAVFDGAFDRWFSIFDAPSEHPLEVGDLVEIGVVEIRDHSISGFLKARTSAPLPPKVAPPPPPPVGARP